MTNSRADRRGWWCSPSSRPGRGSWPPGPVHRLGRAGQLDVAVAFDRGVPVDGAFGLGDLFVDPAQGAPGPIVAELVVDDPVRDAAGLLRLRSPARVG